ncbi:hypothetical protein D9O40_20505 [Clostridium autoethanogenum]|uniref:O-antigen ligase domain-containing protein n=1 Tax=Clostridium autoethanogenum TaxID=84023 RepID=A0A3M0S3X6_9CLOT|nr:hypothetical protein [Clostridium autoethanogenum]RMC92310.1 hypothetical protein D9O40_20505 [Clostridium autoethanogenum]
MVGRIFVIFILFQNIIFNCLPHPDYFSYWDELSYIILLLLYLITKQFTHVRKQNFKVLVVCIGMILVGLSGNIFFGYAYSGGAIIRDIVGFTKFPLTFMVLMDTNYGEKLKDYAYKCIPFIKLMVFIIFAFGVLSLFIDIGMTQDEIRSGIHPYLFIYSHPTYLVSSMICILAILNASEEKLSVVYDLMISIIIILSMRTKGIVAIVVYIFMKYGPKWIRKLKVLYWLAVLMIVIFASHSKLALYASYSNSPRESLYKGALTIIQKCFPIGSGFATYASFVSVNYLSKVYDFVNVAGIYDYTGNFDPEIGDAGFSYYMGQFGLIGSILFIYMAVQIVKASISSLEKDRRLPVILLLVYIAITLTSEAILVNNGFELAVILAIIVAMSKNRGKNCSVHHCRKYNRQKAKTHLKFRRNV